jgi:hypothetical protein
MKKFMILVLCLGLCLAICNTDSWGCSGVSGSGNVQGSNHNWTLIGTVKQGAILRVYASGTVDFGCFACTCVDSATAGVEGKSLVFVRIFDSLKKQADAVMTVNPVQSAQKNLSALRGLFGTTQQPNFDQGGVWIKILRTKGGTPYFGTQLYYFWEHENGINKYGLPINEDVQVYAKAHDGGKNPEATGGYGDNKGYYSVSLFCGMQPPDATQILRGHAADFMAAMKRGSESCTSPAPLAGQTPSGGGAASGSASFAGTGAVAGAAAPGGASSIAHTAAPVSQVGGTSGAGVAATSGSAPSGAATGAQINVRSCSTCVGACPAGHTCIYINNACFLSCQ